MISDIAKHLNKNNLHHAYLIEGRRDAVMPSVLNFVQSLEIEIKGNPDFCDIRMDSFKNEDALNLRNRAIEKGFNDKKVFVVSANNFLLRAQNALLKMFEEPIENTVFFIIVPDINALLPTLVSRFYVIKLKSELEHELINAQKFAAMQLNERIDFIRELLAEPTGDDEEENEVIALNSIRSNALNFLNALESVMHKKAFLQKSDQTNYNYFSQFFKVRKFLRQPGSSAKTLMESVAIITPTFKN